MGVRVSKVVMAIYMKRYGLPNEHIVEFVGEQMLEEAADDPIAQGKYDRLEECLMNV